MSDYGWSLVSPSTPPDARFYHAMAWDQARDKVVLFGGNSASGGTLLADTWTWDPTTKEWTELSPAHAPSARRGHVMAYDTARDVVVLFGGRLGGAGALDSETWEWDGTDWTQMSPATSPPARWLATMSYDEYAGTMVLLGGGHPALTATQDTWTYDGSNWTSQSPSTPPGVRWKHMATYHASHFTVLAFGGSGRVISGFEYTWNDSWEWVSDYSDWDYRQVGSYTEVAAGQAPPPATDYGSYYLSGRQEAALAYHPTVDRSILHGGYSQASGTTPYALNDTWACLTADDGFLWEDFAPAAVPTDARLRHQMVWDGQRMMFFGGQFESGTVTDETWILEPMSFRPLVSLQGQYPRVAGQALRTHN